MLIVGRFIGGVAVGMLTSTIPMYASELSEARYRGTLSGLLQWMLSWGFLVAQWVSDIWLPELPHLVPVHLLTILLP